jgi:hypothetical protein
MHQTMQNQIQLFQIRFFCSRELGKIAAERYLNQKRKAAESQIE